MSISSPARTGTCVRVISRRMAKALRDLLDLRVEVGLVGGVAGAVPDLEVVDGADHDDVLRDARVLVERRVQRDAAGRVELDVERAAAEEAGELAAVGAEWVHFGNEAVLEAVEPFRREDRDTGIEPLRENQSIGELRPELGRDGQPVLRVE